MKTIIIENGLIVVRSSKLKVFVNGVEHSMSDKFLYVDVDDHAPVELMVKHGRWYASNVYKSEPKDKMSLKIVLNQRKFNRICGAILAVAALFGILGYLLRDKQISSHLLNIMILLPSLTLLVIRERYNIIEK